MSDAGASVLRARGLRKEYGKGEGWCARSTRSISTWPAGRPWR